MRSPHEPQLMLQTTKLWYNPLHWIDQSQTLVLAPPPLGPRFLLSAAAQPWLADHSVGGSSGINKYRCRQSSPVHLDNNSLAWLFAPLSLISAPVHATMRTAEVAVVMVMLCTSMAHSDVKPQRDFNLQRVRSALFFCLVFFVYLCPFAVSLTWQAFLVFPKTKL